MGATLNRGKSKQDYRTPCEFLHAVKSRIQIDDFGMDLAADDTNAVCEAFLTKEDNSLAYDWHMVKPYWCWCNPPYSDIQPWVEKAASESLQGAQIAMLVPASVGANWWKHHVHNRAHVLLLNGRITFVGAKDPYPKDCALLLYTPFINGGYEVWTWKTNTNTDASVKPVATIL